MVQAVARQVQQLDIFQALKDVNIQSAQGVVGQDDFFQLSGRVEDMRWQSRQLVEGQVDVFKLNNGFEEKNCVSGRQQKKKVSTKESEMN